MYLPPSVSWQRIRQNQGMELSPSEGVAVEADGSFDEE